MNISDEQKKVIEGWVTEGLGLSEIQRRISSEFEISMTFMDVRMLVLDLGLSVKDKQVKKEKSPAPETATPGEDGLDDAPVSPGMGLGNVSVELDRITQPGTVVSGTVVFGDGEQASWSIDQAGRLVLASRTPDYRPSEQDLKSFQSEIRGALEKRGF